MKTAYIFLAVLVLILYGITLWGTSREGFETGKTVTKKNPYDSVYAAIYDALWNPKELLDYQRVSMQDMMLADWPVSSVKVLDACCGTAPHACWFKKLDLDYVGVDTSEDMLEKASTNCPSAKFQSGDISNATTFSPKSFSHVILLGFSIYQFVNSKMITDNIYAWLQPSGQFVVHLVEPDKFDPLLELATPFAAFSLQKYSLERQTESDIYFDQFKFVGNFNKKKNEDEASYDETFIYYDDSSSPDNVKYREQKHEWSMPSLERMIEIIKSSGFKHIESVHLLPAGKEYQYLVYFSK